ncbi:MAG: MBL fold metallo-hydrolase [Thermoguttaceae bacterium]|nr:MBL fold metallo-hydrolase [Thermoguttaceae bacterium]
MLLSDLYVVSLILSDFEENAWVVRLRDNRECVVIDPGMDPASLIDYLQRQHLAPKAILITHGHWDHIGGIADMKTIWPNLPVYIGEKEQYKLTDPLGNLSAMLGRELTAPAADRVLKDGEEFEVAGIPFKTVFLPGHSCGHVFYLVQDEEGQSVAFVGDIIFSGSVGRSDFPDGDGAALIKGIREKILVLPEQTVLYPGHGPKTTVRIEKASNPWLR